MNIFEKPNKGGGWECPICKTNKDGQVILAGIVGTEDGNNMQAEQIHVDCLELYIHKDQHWIGMKYD